MPDLTKEQLHELKEQLETIVPQEAEEATDLMDSLVGLLALPDEQFEILAPGVLQAYEQSVNNPNDKLALVQALNATGTKAEDLTDAFEELVAQMDESSLPRMKRDFLKQLIGTMIAAINDTEGIAKRIIPVPVELCHEAAKIPQYAHTSDSGMDVFALEDINIAPGEIVLVPTGVKMALPPGYELQARPKSGRAYKTKLRIANTPGTIDAGYRDEIKIIIENIEPRIKDITVGEDGRVTSILYGSECHITKGEKFCQLVLQEVPKAAPYRVESVAEIGENRGGGFGSTGLFAQNDPRTAEAKKLQDEADAARDAIKTLETEIGTVTIKDKETNETVVEFPATKPAQSTED